MHLPRLPPRPWLCSVDLQSNPVKSCLFQMLKGWPGLRGLSREILGPSVAPYSWWNVQRGELSCLSGSPWGLFVGTGPVLSTHQLFHSQLPHAVQKSSNLVLRVKSQPLQAPTRTHTSCKSPVFPGFARKSRNQPVFSPILLKIQPTTPIPWSLRPSLRSWAQSLTSLPNSTSASL